MAVATQPDAAKQLAAIQRKLERWELTHLRAHAASLAERIERLEEELERARTDADHAWRDAECWRGQVQNLIEDLNAAGRDVGMTQTGELVVMPGVDIDAVHLSQVRKAADKAMDAWADRATAALPEHYTPTLTPDALPKLKQAIAASPFVTVGEIAEACGMTAATVTAAAESLLRNALKAAGCVRAKRKASDGVVRWGYITPYVKNLTQPAGESTLPEHLEEPHTPEGAPRACRACDLSAHPVACPPLHPQPTARPAPTELGQSVLAPCSSSRDSDCVSVRTGGAA